ncbi:hypothetical protein V8F20_005488 [Naviculisporaceae sp. PSN 640]
MGKAFGKLWVCYFFSLVLSAEAGKAIQRLMVRRTLTGQSRICNQSRSYHDIHATLFLLTAFCLPYCLYYRCPSLRFWSLTLNMTSSSLLSHPGLPASHSADLELSREWTICCLPLFLEDRIRTRELDCDFGSGRTGLLRNVKVGRYINGSWGTFNSLLHSALS